MLEAVPECVALDNFLVPLWEIDDYLVAGFVHPLPDTIHKLRFILGRAVAALKIDQSTFDALVGSYRQANKV
jgi:hypothetical protein